MRKALLLVLLCLVQTLGVTSKASGMNWRRRILMVAMVLGSDDLNAGDVPIFGSSVMTLIENNDTEQLTRLVELGMSPNSKVYERGKLVEPFTLLEYACFLEKEAAIRMLVNSGADLKLRSKWGDFPLRRSFKKTGTTSPPYWA